MKIRLEQPVGVRNVALVSHFSVPSDVAFRNSRKKSNFGEFEKEKHIKKLDTLVEIHPCYVLRITGEGFALL